MRNLKIKRTKSFVAAFATVQVYIEDTVTGEIKINDVPCRKLGTLKNGEEKTFSIGESATKVFVIADKLSKDFCNEFYPLPEGQEDIFLSGQNKYNLTSGNAFRFDNNNSEAVIANRKKNTRKGALILILALIVGFIYGFLSTSGLFSGKEISAKEFSASGMTLTLTNEFAQEDFEEFTAVYSSEEVAVFTYKDAFNAFEGLEDYTLDQYMDIVLEGNTLSSDIDMKEKDGLIYAVYDYTNPSTKNTHRYFLYVYKASDAFWIIQFATLTELADAYEEKIVEWAKSVKFSNDI